MPKLTKPIIGCSGGEVIPRVYEAGEECPDDLIDAARALGALHEQADARSGGRRGEKSS